MKNTPKTVGEVTAKTAGYKMMEKLQIENLPKNITVEMIQKLMKIFGKVLKVELLNDPVTKIFDGRCFVEFSNEVELQKAASGVMGMKLSGFILETKKVPIGQTADMSALGLLSPTGPPSNCEQGLAVGIAPKVNRALESYPSRVVKLKNLVNIAELFDNAYYDELCEDINEQCQNYGRILSIEVPRPIINGPSIPGLGFVYVQYESVESEMITQRTLNGHIFAGRKVEAVNYPEDSFKKKILDL